MKCNHCERQTTDDKSFVAVRYGGGSYRRAARRYHSRICVKCAELLVHTSSRSDRLADRWEVSTLRYRLEQHLKVAAP